MADRPLQFQDMAKNTTPNALVGQIAEAALYQVEPRRTGGSEVNVKAGLLFAE
jgi:hypothetical protein